jgi:hypothetical protein
MTLDEIVGDYIREYGDDASAERRFFEIQCSLYAATGSQLLRPRSGCEALTDNARSVTGASKPECDTTLSAGWRRLE